MGLGLDNTLSCFNLKMIKKLVKWFERRGLDLSDWRGLLDFWRRIKIKMAAVT